ncbi:TPA: DEAD/DEAH box helicase family protein [Enterococcus faecium]|uniref:DEAD/DEAH box helicase family protein n=1 Tax=Enterococcus faecium TaxID=1352 RepID=UPI001BDD734E|nr:DEAD/DEAH box helicase family protein [Enterococcus faecium]EME7142069.1 DEAD/DEAH box helicase family protein [Enterococcus faecium]MCD4914859.1 DEAD/DEAH box helicase family protein [Enterococcus faecium]MCD5088354.1 DEAD/DEAH box helicase family protein [Enterococcus faecium]MCV3117418.1 DEAD/DEAH box helicase family protein [Enterococcus faecium]MCV3186908.1 DEAD/DEAH box helicase family protein [Enterococcus faecium]
MAKKTKETFKPLFLPLYDELVQLDHSLLNDDLGWVTPAYLAENMVHTFRDYQDSALRYFHYMMTNKVFEYRKLNHVLFNMATGSGKTDLMAGLILYLYQEHSYRNFLFIVNTNSVLNKTIDNLTNSQSNKYLYEPVIEIDGERLTIERVDEFPKNQSKNTIYIKLATVQSVASDIYTQRENSMGAQDYARNKVVILGDEAHHYSASTKTEKETEQSWEKAIITILNANEDNRLLEFTATIDLENKNIYEKYKDKVLYRYGLDRFIQDRYSKNVKRIQSSNTDEENMLNVVLLSEFRRRYAYELYGSYIKPVIMFKSQKIDASNEANELFNQLVEKLSPDYVLEFIKRQNKTISETQSETLGFAYEYFLKNEKELPQIVKEIKREFSPTRVINANDSDRGGGMLEKGQYEALNSLESPDNLYRVIFAVAKLTEGWDVLNLYDIVRISDRKDTKGNKTTTMAEAQLIGRGARYNPFELDGKKSYQRRFEDDSNPSLILETLHYHTINEPQYLKNLVAALDDMNLPTGEDKKNPLLDVKVKPKFKKTNVWKNGKLYYNQSIQLSDDYYDTLAKYSLNNQEDIVINWLTSAKEVNYKAETIYEDFADMHQIPVEIDRRFIEKAMNRLTFFHFNNLKKYIPLLNSREEFLGEKWLNIQNRTIYANVPIKITRADLTAEEKLRIVELYLLEVAQKIKKNSSSHRGTNKFIGYPLKDYVTDYKKRIPNYDTSKLFMDKNPQTVQRYVIDEDYFVYESAIINLTEKQLIDRIGERVEELKEHYSEVYLIRMDENMHRESAKSENMKLHEFNPNAKDVHFEGFQPDFILYLQNAEFFLQVFIEPKGSKIEEQQWKEDLLMYINDNEAELVFEDDVNGVKIKGLKFYTINDGRNAMKQLAQIAIDGKFRGLSM